MCVYYLVRNYTALQDEEKLKNLYVELTDERNSAISKETKQTASAICIIVTSIACIISGFINEIVCLTLCADILLSVIITVVVQLYYKNKM